MNNTALKDEKAEMQIAIGQLKQEVDVALVHSSELEGRLSSQEREIDEKTTALSEAVAKVNQAVK